MKLLDLTLPTPEANLAIDEALLNESENAELGAPGNYANVLRIWESPTPMVVIGRGSKRSVEANVAECERQGVPILRRCSGGTSVVAGPGCLMYAVILSYEEYPELRSVDTTHQFVMQRMQQALQRLKADVQFCGSSDLAIDNQKISGNSLRCKRRHLLYHGTVLYNFPLEQISKLLGTPPRMPDYRQRRDHRSFVTNFGCDAKSIRNAILQTWDAHERLDAWPETATERLIREQYALRAWHERV